MAMVTNFYVNPEDVKKDSLKITGEEAKHILSVLRYGSRDVIDVVDGCGTKYEVRIDEISRDFLEGSILSRTQMENEPKSHLTLAQAVCRRERMDFLIEKTTEIGVSSIIPIITERNTVKISKVSRERKKIDRWRKIAIAAMKQSLRTVLPEIHEIIKFDRLLSKIKDFDISLIASLDKDSKSLKQCIQLKKGVKSVLLVVGPEAGFTEEELSKAKARGAIPISLGSRRLRTETAGVVFSSLVLHQLDDLGLSHNNV
jgi:16S rRNA (uracil1498-N3)-methyltransferase